MHPLLELKNITKQYKVSSGLLGLQSDYVHAVDGITFSVERGRTLGLVGESGCGKSTLAKCILGLESTTTGDVIFQGKNVDLWDEKQLRKEMQMVFQDPYSSLNPRQKVGTIIREGLDIHKLGTAQERREQVEKLLDLVGLRPEYGKRYPHEFSGGQRQRIAIARALALSPQLIICDEPVSALDVSVQAQVLHLLKQLQSQLDLTYVFISHDLSVVSHIADVVAVMYLGRLMEMGDSSSIFDTPSHPYTQALLSSVLLPAPHTSTKNIPIQNDTPGPITPSKGCPFHPRCPHSFKKCQCARPQLRPAQNGNMVACWLYADTQTTDTIIP